MRYISGVDRNQSLLFPERVDEYITDSNPARFIDAYVDSLDLAALGFRYASPEALGRKPYDPADMLKLHLYGYLNKIRSSRQLETATYRNIELLWLLRKLHPDFKTIADFRKATPVRITPKRSRKSAVSSRCCARNSTSLVES